MEGDAASFTVGNSLAKDNSLAIDFPKRAFIFSFYVGSHLDSDFCFSIKSFTLVTMASTLHLEPPEVFFLAGDKASLILFSSQKETLCPSVYCLYNACFFTSLIVTVFLMSPSTV